MTDHDEMRALVAKWRESARGAKRYSVTEYEDGFASAEKACADQLAAALAAQEAKPAGGEGVVPDAVRALPLQWRHSAQGCGRRDQHAAGTWRSCARELEAAMLAAAPQPAKVEASYTTGHCENHKMPGGCQLHNLRCGWPKCDRRPIPQPAKAEG